MFKLIFKLGILVALPGCENRLVQSNETTEAALKTYENVNLVPRCNIRPFGLCGYIAKDLATKYQMHNLVLPAEFEKAELFYEGLAAVRVKGKYGYINASGAFEIPAQYDLAGSFDHGLAVVEIDGLLGVINRAAEVVVKPQFSHLTIHDSETLIAQLPVPEDLTKSVMVANRALKIRPPKQRRKEIYNAYYAPINPAHEWANPIMGSLYNIQTGWVDIEHGGTEGVQFKVFDPKNRGLIWATRGRMQRLMRPDGSWVDMRTYSQVKPLINGRAIVSNGSAYFGLDENGTEVFAPSYGRIFNFEGELAKVERYTYRERKKRNKLTEYGLINQSGELLGRKWFRGVNPQSRAGKKYVRSENSFNYQLAYQWTQFSPAGAVIREDAIDVCPNYVLAPVIDPTLDPAIASRTPPKIQHMKVLNPAGERILDANFDAIWGNDRMFDRRGADIIGAQFRGCTIPSRVSSNSKFGMLLPDGTLMGGRLFDKIARTSGPRFWVSDAEIANGKWGQMNQDGSYHIAPEYDGLEYGESHMKLTKNNSSSLTFATRFIHGGISYSDTPTRHYNTSGKNRCQSGGSLITKNNLWGIIDTDGTALVPIKHRALTCFESGRAWAPHEDKRQWCQIDKSGEFDLSTPCKTTHYLTKRSVHPFQYLPAKFDEDPFESSVKWTQSLLHGPKTRPNPDPTPLWFLNNYRMDPEKITIPYEIAPED